MDESIVSMHKEYIEHHVDQAWEEEESFFKKLGIINTEGRKASWCQGLSRNLRKRLGGLFNCRGIVFKVKRERVETPHVVLLVESESADFIVDATIKQFLPECNETVFFGSNYPLPIDSPKAWY